MPDTYRLDVFCPYCETITEIADWPRTETSAFAFTCLAKQGGCGGHALVIPREVTGFPELEVMIVVGTPLTQKQYEEATAPRSTPPAKGGA
jgi:hypothetical protein